ncbi:hypothetical protein E1176_16560 [Fulvivirga sp. RKSG066]|nr:hypothetical protein [Fulvivirga aurantia]
MSGCSTQKICYDSKVIAEEALMQNRARNNYAAGQGPINVYLCHICNCYHFTSKGEPSDLLKTDKDRIDRLREASYWEDKFRK